MKKMLYESDGRRITNLLISGDISLDEAKELLDLTSFDVDDVAVVEGPDDWLLG